ncbi:hypothetical protein AXF42_Ash011245 [Apostasia shenzhenica]|uniref:Uncharacterized protein n=1 Tax=Apostasia shenzhenica TaxID=1088818 RepID=A0A2I0ALC7_9ASPA|nr:hypothetical protein AXF42_Ash011245 [Apostasia shenzhenica]
MHSTPLPAKRRRCSSMRDSPDDRFRRTFLTPLIKLAIFFLDFGKIGGFLLYYSGKLSTDLGIF